jgi:hypothetical protein
LESTEVPFIYLFPAFHKRPPFFKYMGSELESEMAEFILKFSDIKFEITMDLKRMEAVKAGVRFNDL